MTASTSTSRRVARWVLPALVAAGCATGATLAATAPSAGASTTSNRQTITVYGEGIRLPHDGMIDVNGDGPGVGDEMVVADTLRDKAHHDVGMARGVCTITHGSATTKNAEADCVGTALLDGRGQITFQGIEHLTQGDTVICAITGGTGHFVGWTGWVHVTLHEKTNTTTYVFNLRH